MRFFPFHYLPLSLHFGFCLKIKERRLLVPTKTFVIDTNVLLHDPEAITKFPRHIIVIPVSVLEELDKMKRLPNELGKNSRAVFRFLDSLNTLKTGDLHQGVQLSNESIVRIHLEIKADYKATFGLS